MKNDVTQAIQLQLHENKMNKKQILGGDCDSRNKNPVGEIKNQEKANKRLFYRFAAI